MVFDIIEVSTLRNEFVPEIVFFFSVWAFGSGNICGSRLDNVMVDQGRSVIGIGSLNDGENSHLSSCDSG